MLHELLHTIGFVPTCAPHFTRAGHVSDSNHDLMYAGDQPWYPSVLDYGHDDYFDAHIPGCPDVSDSPLLARAVGHAAILVARAPVSRSGRTRLPVACLDSGNDCHGSLVLARARTTIATAPVTLAAGTGTMVTLRLTRSARARLAGHRHVTVTATAPGSPPVQLELDRSRTP
jgi:hypothetical protein